MVRLSEFDPGLFPQRLQKLREQRQISRKVMSELCGLSKNMIARYEKGETEPTASTVAQIAEFFNVSTDFLLGKNKF